MKITHNKVGQNLNTVDGPKSERVDKKNSSKLGALSESSAGVGESTSVKISDRAQDIKKIKDIAMKGDEIDEAKVAKFQKLIDEGNYKVDSAAVADKMVDEQLLFS